jgi:cytochrome c oxidase subunit 2
MAQWGQLTFQDAASPIIAELISFHDHAILIVASVVSFVRYILTVIIFSTYTSRTLVEADTLETVWTIIPGIILVILALPSLRLLYLIDEIPDPQISIKVIGHQWYWTYEYLGIDHLSFDSFILRTPDLPEGGFRLLEVDHRAVLPILADAQALITSADVIHSWAVPCLGVKVDAIPGRQNQVGFTILRPGVFYGQCSEICGTDHSFIPIAIEAVDLKTFISWINP